MSRAEVWPALVGVHKPAPPLYQPMAGAAGPYKFVSLSTSGALRAGFTTADAGKTARSALRWVSTRGEKGPWSEIASATVAA